MSSSVISTLKEDKHVTMWSRLFGLGFLENNANVISAFPGPYKYSNTKGKKTHGRVVTAFKIYQKVLHYYHLTYPDPLKP